MGKDKKKTHRMFHFDQTNASWFKIGVTNFGSPVHEGGGMYFWKFPKRFYGEGKEKDA